MKREEIIKEFDKAGINFDINTDLPYGSADYIDDSFSRVLDLVEKLVSKNKSLHLVSKCLKCEPMEYDVEGVRYFKCKHCGKEMK